MSVFDPSSLPYAEWLENSLRNLASKRVDSLCIMAVTEDSEVLTGYYNCSVSDKFLMSGYLNQDAMIETLQANGLIPSDEDEEDEEYEDCDDEDEEDLEDE